MPNSPPLRSASHCGNPVARFPTAPSSAIGRVTLAAVLLLSAFAISGCGDQRVTTNELDSSVSIEGLSGSSLKTAIFVPPGTKVELVGVTNIPNPRFAWSVKDGNGRVFASGTSASFTFSVTKPGPNTVLLVVTGSGITKSASATINILEQGCTPTSCAAQNKNCGPIPDGCGAILNCGNCTAPATCGGGGTPNVCGSPACTPATTCPSGQNCGTAPDGCGGTLKCGTCPTGQSCSSSNQCVASCTPATTCPSGQNCGTASDGCGGKLNCGTCPVGQSCSSNNQCVASCTPAATCPSGQTCGTAPDNCGGTINCGPPCTSGFATVTVSVNMPNVPGPGCSNGSSVTVTLPRKAYQFVATGKTYYIATNGSDNNGGSLAAPFATFAHAIPLLKPGDILYVEGGTYPEPFTVTGIAGTANNRITISAAPGPSAGQYQTVNIVQPPGWQAQLANINSATIEFTGASTQYITLNGFNIYGALGQSNLPQPDHYGQDGITLSGGAGVGIWIVNNNISLAMHCGIKEEHHGGTNFTIEGNISYCNGVNNLDHGMYIPSSNVVLRGNAMIQNASLGFSLYAGGRGITGQAVYNNIAFGNGNQGLLEDGGPNLIAHNVTAGNLEGGVSLFRDGCVNNQFLNNISAHNVYDGNTDWGEFTADNGGGQLGNPTGNVINFNGLFPKLNWATGYGSVQALIYPEVPTPDRNIYDDPQFVDLANHDYRIQATSPLKNAATPVSLLGATTPTDIGLFSANAYTGIPY